MSLAFYRQATVQASTKRSPALTGRGRKKTPEPYLDDIRVTPLDPAETQQARETAFRLRQVLDSAMEFLETYTEATNDIVEGDVLVVEGTDYPVRDVATWKWRTTVYLRLLVEDVKY